ncbi:MAG: Gas vesicle synthesis GvpLGvpF [Gemmatimonadetes bacterium]|nr:Gas vesicle synthesis GvpLGvpF [Gemmatimonadota bacterium]
MALNLFGVTVNDAHSARANAPGAELVAVRDLAAICAEVEYRGITPDEEAVARYSEVVAAYAVTGPVLPAPVGVVFRSSDSVKRWLELHYGALSEAMTFVENRVAGRVHVWRPGKPEEREVGAELAAVAAESLRVLRHSAIATLPLRVEKLTGIVLSAAFLVESERWKDFAAEVDAQAKMTPSVRFELTGPFPPYDFVQMQLGA